MLLYNESNNRDCGALYSHFINRIQAPSTPSIITENVILYIAIL